MRLGRELEHSLKLTWQTGVNSLTSEVSAACRMRWLIYFLRGQQG